MIPYWIGENIDVSYLKNLLHLMDVNFAVDRKHNVFVWSAKRATLEHVLNNYIDRKDVILTGALKEKEYLINSETVIEGYDYSFFENYLKNFY